MDRPDTISLIESLNSFLTLQTTFQTEFLAKGNKIAELSYKNIHESFDGYQKYNHDFFEDNNDNFVFSLHFKADSFSNFHLYMEKAVFNTVA